MKKTVFRYAETSANDTPIFLPPPISAQAAVLEAQAENAVEVEEYKGPTMEELRQETELFKTQWEAERETMILSAKLEADRIIKEAEESAFQAVTQKTQEAESLKQKVQAEAARIITEARQKAQDLVVGSQSSIEKQQREAEERGLAMGREMGFKEGKVEADRLIQRTQVILARAQDKRNEILIETEYWIIDLVILLARKVIKVISENQREVIVSNVQEALRKVKGRGGIIIKIHTADLQMAAEHLKDFIGMLEGSSNIQVQEDSSVDQGGCVIETDFGEIDARISSQLVELETKIMEIAPIKTKPKIANSFKQEKV